MNYADSNMDSDHVCDSSKPNKCAGLKPHWTQLSGIKQRSKLHHFELKISTHIVENVISQTKKEWCNLDKIWERYDLSKLNPDSVSLLNSGQKHDSGPSLTEDLYMLSMSEWPEI